LGNDLEKIDYIELGDFTGLDMDRLLLLAKKKLKNIEQKN